MEELSMLGKVLTRNPTQIWWGSNIQSCYLRNKHRLKSDMLFFFFFYQTFTNKLICWSYVFYKMLRVTLLKSRCHISVTTMCVWNYFSAGVISMLFLNFLQEMQNRNLLNHKILSTRCCELTLFRGPNTLTSCIYQSVQFREILILNV